MMITMRTGIKLIKGRAGHGDNDHKMKGFRELGETRI